jgi:plastocyanin
MRTLWTRIVLTGAVLLPVVFSVACGSSSVNPVSPTPAPGGGGGGGADVTISISNMSFAPASMTVKVGQSVAWHNADSVTHTATANSGAFDTGAIASGGTSAAIVMNTAGTFPYHCSIHPEMLATLIVTQ